MTTLPNPPCIRLEVIENSIIPEKGFLRLHRSQTIFHYPNGEKSDPFLIDSVGRMGFDAVTIAAHYRDEQTDQPMVYLRSAVRPALAFRDYSPTGLPESEHANNTWELPAGLVEKTEIGPDGIMHAAQREMEEELGFIHNPNAINWMNPMGPRIFSCVGLSAERIYFFEVEVNPEDRLEPTLDGSPFEKHGVVVAIPLREALEAVEAGLLPDAKTEIGLNRLARIYGIG